MARKSQLTGYRLIVKVGDFHPETQRRDCETIARTVRTLVDVEAVEIESNIVDTCSHCGEPWTEGDTSPHNGGCCDADAAVVLA